VRVVAVAGSLQERSSNAALLRAAVAAAPPGMEIDVFRGLGDVPHLDPGLDGDAAPAAVRDWRARLGAAEGLLIVTPEYGHSMPGVLKNALDWLVGSGELSNLPVALMSASTTPTGGLRAQMALVQTLLAQAAYVPAMLTVPGVKARLGPDGEIADPAVRRRAGETLVALAEAIEERRAWRAG
jgi:chromate reductase, NAD(P)H dehydrogenase (quinone)